MTRNFSTDCAICADEYAVDESGVTLRANMRA